MAKITTDVRHIGGTRYEFPIKCSSKGLFSTDYPKDFWGIDHKNEFSTQNELLREIGRVCSELVKLKKETNFLLCYTITHKNKLMSIMSNEDPTVSGLELSYAVVMEKKVGSDVSLFKLREGKVSNLLDEGEGIPDGFCRSGRISDYAFKGFKHKVPFDAGLYEKLKMFSKAIEDMANMLAEKCTPEEISKLGTTSFKLIQ